MYIYIFLSLFDFLNVFSPCKYLKMVIMDWQSQVHICEYGVLWSSQLRHIKLFALELNCPQLDSCIPISCVFLCLCRKDSVWDRDIAILQAMQLWIPTPVGMKEEPQWGTVTRETEQELASVLPQVQHQVVPGSSAIPTAACTTAHGRAVKDGETLCGC